MRPVLLLLIVGLLVAADGPDYPRIDWSAAAPGATGRSEGVLKHPDTGVQIMKYQIYAPDRLPESRTLGLVVGFHGLGGNEGAAASGYWPMREIGHDQDYVFIGGKSVGNGWEPSDEPMLLQFIDWAETVYPIDRRRVFYWGFSNGGWAVGYYGSRHAHRVAGIVRWAGYGTFVPEAKDPADTMLEWYLVHGDSDPTVKVGGSRGLRTALMAKDYRFVYREIIGGDHGNILGRKEVSNDAAAWVHARRHKSVLPGEADLAVLKDLAKDRKVEARLDDAAIWSDLVRIGGPLVWPIVEKAFKAKDPAVRLCAVQASAATTFAGDATIVALAKTLGDDDAGIRAASIAALGIHANWRSQTAQVALAKLALNAKAPADERLAATKALAGVLPLPFLGNFSDDPAAFQGITALLNADDEAIRRAAFAPIPVGAGEDFGYDPAAVESERKRGIIAWQQWYEGRIGLVEGKPVAAKR